MPVYTIYHQSLIVGKARDSLAVNLTNLHCEVTGTPREEVKIIFIPLDHYSFYWGGEKTRGYVRIVAQIRCGRTDAQKTNILRGMYEVAAAADWEPKLKEIQTQIDEIDDTKTVMTNGVLND